MRLSILFRHFYTPQKPHISSATLLSFLLYGLPATIIYPSSQHLWLPFPSLIVLHIRHISTHFHYIYFPLHIFPLPPPSSCCLTCNRSRVPYPGWYAVACLRKLPYLPYHISEVSIPPVPHFRRRHLCLTVSPFPPSLLSHISAREFFHHRLCRFPCLIYLLSHI